MKLLLTVSLFALAAFAQTKQADPALPAGPHKALVEDACGECHGLNLLSGGHTPREWTLLMDRMLSAGARIPKDQVASVTDYIAKAFPATPDPKAVILPGTAKVTFKEWTVPTKGSRPHDPLSTPDGMFWYTGHYVNTLGRLDPKSGEFSEFHPPTERSGPHGLVNDKDGNIWFTGNYKGYIGKFDPKSKKFTDYKLPAEARDPHTPIFDQKGILWFSVQQSNLVGRLDPKTGDIKLVQSPTAKSLPYGMVVDSKGWPFYVEFGAPKVAAIDPATLKIQEWTLPNASSRPRRIAITPDDIIYYADYSRGFLGRLDPKSGKIDEFASPSGPNSQPYGITYLNGAIWYNEGNAKPNTLVRFDLKTQKMQSWAIPSGGGVVRNMTTTADGNLAMALSGVNMIGIAYVGK